MAPRRPNVFVLEVQNKAALPVIESAHAHGRRVIAGAPRRYCLGFYSRSVRERVIYPSPVDDPERCIAFLLRYLSRGHVDVLFPTDDAMTDLVARHQDAIRRHTRLVIPPYEVFSGGRDKILTLQAAERAGVPIPRTWYPHEQGLEAVAAEAEYPCLIKPAVSAGARGMTLVNAPEELTEKLPAVEQEFGRCFVQDFVPHTDVQYKVDAVMGEGGRLLAGVVYSKLRYYPPSGGSSVLYRIVRRPDVLDLAVSVMRELKWYGFCDFDFITDPRDGLVKLMEINPRYPESFRATCVAGVDMTEMIYQLACGLDVAPQLDYRAGGFLRFLPGDLLWFLTSRDRFQQLRSFLTSFTPSVRCQIVSRRDPGPLIGYLLENLLILASPAERATRFRLRQARQSSPSQGE